MSTPQDDAVIGLISSVIQRPESSQQHANISVDDYITVADVNTGLFQSTTSSPVTAQNLGGINHVTATFRQVNTGSGYNISDNGELRMADVSGFWKITLVMNESRYGRAESHVHGPNRTLDQAIAAAKDLAAYRCELFGNAMTTSFKKSPGTPQIEFVKISDALNPRVATIVDREDAGCFGFKNNPNEGADFFSTAINLRIKGENMNDATVTSYANCALVGNPDHVVVNGQYAGTAASVKAGMTYDDALRQYVNRLLQPNQFWGYMGQSVSQPKKTASLASYDNTLLLWKFACTAHGYSTNDRIRISSANSNRFNGTYKIIAIDANTIAIAGGPPAETPAFTLAKVQRLALANGAKALDFYKYKECKLPPFVTKKNPGRQILKQSFRRRTRKK